VSGSTAPPTRCWMWPGCSLDTAPQDRSSEDRTLVVVQVSAEQLGDVPQHRRLTETFPRGRKQRCVTHGTGRVG
jgi:hypothetical protein